MGDGASSPGRGPDDSVSGDTVTGSTAQPASSTSVSSHNRMSIAR